MKFLALSIILAFSLNDIASAAILNIGNTSDKIVSIDISRRGTGTGEQSVVITSKLSFCEVTKDVAANSGFTLGQLQSTLVSESDIRIYCFTEDRGHLATEIAVHAYAK